MTEDSDSNEQVSDSEASIRERLGSSRRTFMKGASAAAGGAALGSTSGAAGGSDGETEDEDGSNGGNGGPTNVILYIGDGQGMPHISAARYLKAYREDAEEFPLNVTDTPLHLDRHEAHGSVTTFPNDPEQFVADSAATATSIGSNCPDCAASATEVSAGVKTYNGAIGGIIENGEFVHTRSVLEEARDMGYATGLVSTSRMTHATPAAFAAHVPDRGMEDEIARQYIEESDVDVLFGGARQYFMPESREDDDLDLINAAQGKGYEYVEDANGLNSLSEAPALGLFSEESHMSYYVDRKNGKTDEPGLPDMAEKAINLLEAEGGDTGFFMMVESARIDHASHANDPAVVQEQLEADETVGTLLDYAEEHEDTLVISTADHECGGLSLGVDGPYQVNFDVLDELDASNEVLDPAIEEIPSQVSGSDAEVASVSLQEEAVEVFTELTGIDDVTESEAQELRSFYRQPREIINERARIGWNSMGHTGEDIPTYAHGPGADFFDGANDNTDIAQVMFEAIGAEASNSE